MRHDELLIDNRKCFGFLNLLPELVETQAKRQSFGDAVPGRHWSCSNFEPTHERAITKTRRERTRTDPHRGCRVECTCASCEASQCSSTAINEQEEPERKRALCLKGEEGKRTGL